MYKYKSTSCGTSQIMKKRVTNRLENTVHSAEFHADKVSDYSVGQ